jgi:hypothetical protein
MGSIGRGNNDLPPSPRDTLVITLGSSTENNLSNDTVTKEKKNESTKEF